MKHKKKSTKSKTKKSAADRLIDRRMPRARSSRLIMGRKKTRLA